MSLRDILAAPPTTGALNGVRQERLTSLVWSIPYSSQKSLQNIFMLTQYALGVDYINHALFCKSIKGKKAIAQRKAEVKNGELTLTGQEEPFEKFLIKALATGKTWEELIHQDRISKVFIHIESLWQHREYFIMYICDAYYPKQESLYLAFRCIFRTSEAILSKVLLVRDSHYYKTRLQSWMSKQVHEIEKLEDKQLSLLIQSVKKEMTLTATIKNLGEYLNFQWIDKFCELHWLNFLCFRLQNTKVKEKEIFKTCELRRKITWKKFDRNQKARYNGEVAYRLEKKLQNCLKKCVVFEQYFVDQLQVILLNSIRYEIPWSEVKQKINSIFTETTTEIDESKQNAFQSIEDDKLKSKSRAKGQRIHEIYSDQQLQENIHGKKQKTNQESAVKYVDSYSSQSSQFDLTNQQIQAIEKTQQNTKKLFMNLPAFDSEAQRIKETIDLSNDTSLYEKQEKLEQTKDEYSYSEQLEEILHRTEVLTKNVPSQKKVDKRKR